MKTVGQILDEVDISTLSRALGYQNPSTVSRWVSGARPPHRKGNLQRLAKALGVDAGDLAKELVNRALSPPPPRKRRRKARIPS